ncbi:hypothetical protein [Leeia sp.]|uniref:hypothetical protein n=1 Tax=Leeia sp. TaxID=2884678 RepID=UPI0035AEAAB1
MHPLLSRLLLILLLCCGTAQAQDLNPANLYRALAPLPKTRLEVQGAVMDVAFQAQDLSLSQAEVVAWIEQRAQWVSAFYGRFPVDRVEVLVDSAEGDRVLAGIAWGQPYPALRVTLGRKATLDALNRDGLLIHEMIHLGTPMLPNKAFWFLEGVADYSATLVRAKIGAINETQAWRGLVRSMWQAIPKMGERGLDYPMNGSRVYWAGVYYCMQADLRLRQQSDNQIGFMDALRHLNRETRGIADYTSLDRVLTTLDGVDGGATFRDLYQEMREEPVSPDLPLIWLQLGLRFDDDLLEFDNTTELAPLRAAIMRRYDEESALAAESPAANAVP